MEIHAFHPDAVSPYHATEDSAGKDLFAIEYTVIPAGKVEPVRTGVAVAIPKKFFGLIKERSSWAIRKSVFTVAGVIDADYRGEILVCLKNDGEHDVIIEKGDKIAQLIVMPYLRDAVEVDRLNSTARGTGGFGSTG